MARALTIIFGLILVLFGLFGFVSNPLIGANAIFISNSASNFINVVLGAILLIIAFWFKKNSVFWLKIIGAVIFVLGLIGLLIVPSIGGSLFDLTYTNAASNWFYLSISILVFVALIYSKNE